MKHIVLLTKPYNIFDVNLWYKYHKAMGWTIHVIDNSAQDDVKKLVDLTHGDTYESLKGWPNQWQLFDDVLNENRYGFQPGELVAFIDDDEFIWYYKDYWKKFDARQPECANREYPSLEKYVDKCLLNMKDSEPKANDVILMPQILMSTPFIHDNRDARKNLIDMCVYRRNDATAQGKCIIKYNSNLVYQFNNKDTSEVGHAPFVYENANVGRRVSIVNGYGCSNTTYGALDVTAHLRLYHYHIKTKCDWERKWTRGSAAVEKQWYDKNIYHNSYANGYIIPDFTMQQTKTLFEL